MKIKAIIFDLDDTLFDTTGQLRARKFLEAIKAMEESGLKKEYIPLLEKEFETKSFLESVEILKDKAEKHVIEKGMYAYNNVDVDHITPFPDVITTLQKLNIIKVLVSTGLNHHQEEKIKVLQIGKYFDRIYIDEIGEKKSKKDYFLECIKKFRLKPEEIIVVGDKIFSEIKAGNELGMITVRILSGMYAQRKPKTEKERADHTIQRISEIFDVLQREEHKE